MNLPEKKVRQEKEIYHDNDLNVEAYRINGLFQKFPPHFHDYYVCGFIQKGRRHMECHGLHYDLVPGDIILFHPGESHCCQPVGDEPTDYRAINVSAETMERIFREVTDSDGTPRFKTNTIYDPQLAECINNCFTIVMEKGDTLAKEEALVCFLTELFEKHVHCNVADEEPKRAEIQRTAYYIEENFFQPIKLHSLCRIAGLTSSAYIKAFTKEKGITPYKFLESIRITESRKMIEEGKPLAEVALSCGFIDQSHFSNSFKRLTGITAGEYQRMFVNRS